MDYFIFIFIFIFPPFRRFWFELKIIIFFYSILKKTGKVRRFDIPADRDV